jgi:hypothetical protein
MTPPIPTLEAAHDTVLTRNTRHYHTKAERPLPRLVEVIEVVEAILVDELRLLHD